MSCRGPPSPLHELVETELCDAVTQWPSWHQNEPQGVTKMMNAEVIEKIAEWAVKVEPHQALDSTNDELFLIIQKINPSIVDLFNKYDDKLGLDSILANASFVLSDICYMLGLVNGAAIAAGYDKPEQVRPIIEMIVRLMKYERPRLFEKVEDVEAATEPASALPN
jgi:hypothetical protein